MRAIIARLKVLMALLVPQGRLSVLCAEGGLSREHKRVCQWNAVPLALPRSLTTALRMQASKGSRLE